MDSTKLRVNRAISIVPNDQGGFTVINTNTGNASQITAYHFGILEAFLTPSTINSAISTLGQSYGNDTLKDIGNVINTMFQHNVLVNEDHRGMSKHDRNYFGAYQALSSQKEMLMDTARTLAFEAAIEEVIIPEDVVIDVGSGTGILSLFAARKKAKIVYSIERSKIIILANAITEKNGFSGRISMQQCMAEDFTCPDKATVIVSEWLGDFVLRELMFKSFCSVRDRFAAPGARCIPSRVRMYIAPIEDALLWQTAGPGYWTSSVYGFDFTPALEIEYARLGSRRVNVPETSLLSTPMLVHDIDCTTTLTNDFYFESQVEFTVSRNSSLHGFAGSFDMQLSPSVWLDTGSHSKETHWQQVFFPLTDALPVQRDDRIVLKIIVQDPENPQKRIPDSYLDVEVWSGNKRIHHFAGWYDKARHGVF